MPIGLTCRITVSKKHRTLNPVINEVLRKKGQWLRHDPWVDINEVNQGRNFMVIDPEYNYR